MDNRENEFEIKNDDVSKNIYQKSYTDNVYNEDRTTKKIKDKKGILGALGVIFAALLKFKGIIFIFLAKFKFALILLKLGKFASTLISMLVTIFIYARMYGLAYGIGFVLLIFIHEMGHYLTAKAIKLDVSLPLFIPFVGAAVKMREQPKDAVTEAKMAIGGPLLGTIGSLICFLLYFGLKENFMMALAYSGFMLNLFNLMPVHPLDGGRVVSAISPKLWIIGIPIGIIAVFKFFNPIILILLVLGIIKVVEQYKNPNKSYYEVKPLIRVIFAVVYFGLILFLGIGIAYIHSYMAGMGMRAM